VHVSNAQMLVSVAECLLHGDCHMGSCGACHRLCGRRDVHSGSNHALVVLRKVMVSWVPHLQGSIH
jgi:hypothetical protein